MESFYEKLAKHQITESWDFREALEELHLWRERFCVEFKLEIPAIAIAIGDISRHRLGQFRYGHNEFGFRGEITISRRHVIENASKDKWWRVLGTLLHELLHAWQELHGKPGKRNYHNKEFRLKAIGLGLIIDQRGLTKYDPESPFTGLLEKHGVEAPIPDLVSPPPKPPPGKSKMKLWMCGCPIRVRCANPRYEACCRHCNQLYEVQS